MTIGFMRKLLAQSEEITTDQVSKDQVMFGLIQNEILLMIQNLNKLRQVLLGSKTLEDYGIKIKIL